MLKNVISSLGLSLLLAPAAADTLTFEDRPVDLTLLGSYQGFNWNSAGAGYTADWNYGFPDTGLQYGAVSGSKILVSADTLSITLGSPGSFDLAGAWFTAAYDWVPQSLSFIGKSAGNTLYTLSAQTLSASAASYVTLGWSGIDEFVVVNEAPEWSWVMDNMDYSISASPIPEPATWGLLLAGLGLLRLASSRRRT